MGALVLNILKIFGAVLNLAAEALALVKRKHLEEKREEIRSDSSSEWAASFGVRRKGEDNSPS